MADGDMRSAWPAGIATGVGSMPGTDPVEAAAVIAGELPDLPHLVELPHRGAGADMIGRAMAVCVDMPVEVVPSGWRLTRRPGRDARRARDFLAWDLDAAEQHFAGAPRVKLQVAGPWTLAAAVELPSGNRALLDPGAVADLAASLAEGLAQQRADLARRLPGAELVVQIDEPLLPAVLAGRLATASGFGTVSAVDRADAVQVLAAVIGPLADGLTVAHCCHPDIPVALLREAGFAALSMDLTDVGTAAARLDPIGEAVEAGVTLLAGLVPTSDRAHGGDPDGNPGRNPDLDDDPDEYRGSGPVADTGARAGTDTDTRPVGFRDAVRPLQDLWRQLGLPAARLAQVTVTPTCGLAGASPAAARRALAVARDAARLVEELAQGG